MGNDSEKIIVPAAGAVCRALRALRGMSQPELAEAVGVSRQTVYQWERGGSRMDSYHLQICNTLGVSTAEWEEMEGLYERSTRRLVRSARRKASKA